MKNNAGATSYLKGKLIDVIALIVAMSAVAFSVMQGNTQKRLEIINKQPLMNIEFIKGDSLAKKNLLGFLLKNVGFGPAEIVSFKYYKNEDEYRKKIKRSSWVANDTAIAIPMPFTFEEINMLEPGYILSNDNDNKLYLLGTSHIPFFYSPTALAMNKVIIEIEYKSISPFDDHVYFLRFCENFVQNNIREKEAKNVYE